MELCVHSVYNGQLVIRTDIIQSRPRLRDQVKYFSSLVRKFHTYLRSDSCVRNRRDCGESQIMESTPECLCCREFDVMDERQGEHVCITLHSGL